MGTLADRLDIKVDTVTVDSRTGVYLNEVATGGSLIIDTVQQRKIQVDVTQLAFSNASTLFSIDRTSNELSDVQNFTGPIVITVQAGDLRIRDGVDADDLGIRAENAGEIALQTVTSGRILLDTTIQTNGTFTLFSAESIDETSDEAAVLGDPTSSVLLLNVGTFAHLHDTRVFRLDATVVSNALLNTHAGAGNWQQVDHAAALKGMEFLNVLNPDRSGDGGSGTEKGVIQTSLPDGNVRNTDARDSIDSVRAEFNFETKYANQYALFLVNRGELHVDAVTAGLSANPNVYIQTRAEDLEVNGLIVTDSNSATEGGIVLIGGQKLSINGGMIETLRLGPQNTQIVTFINQPAALLNATLYNGGQGSTFDVDNLTSTQFVIRSNSVSALAQDFRSHVQQRVVMQFGVPGEAGFVAFVGYADNEIQQFDSQGEAGVPNDIQLTNLDPIASKPSGVANDAEVFTRAIPFQDRFLDSHQSLTTVAIIRRSSDFFFFDHNTADGSVQDLTFETQQITDVSTLGAQGATVLPTDPKPIDRVTLALTPPDAPLSVVPQQIIRQDDIPVAIQRGTEVSLYRISFYDKNDNGQAEQSELPNAEEIKNADVVDDDAQLEQTEKDERLKKLRIKEVKSETGGTVTPEEIDRFKAMLLADPEQASGAYSIIQKDANNNEVVLEIFSIRDFEEQQNIDQPVVQPEDPQSKANEQEQNQNKEESEAVVPADTGDKNASVDQPKWTRGKWESRFASAGVLAGSLLMLRESLKGEEKSNLLDELADANGTETSAVGFDRRSRRLRRFQNKAK